MDYIEVRDQNSQDNINHVYTVREMRDLVNATQIKVFIIYVICEKRCENAFTA